MFKAQTIFKTTLAFSCSLLLATAALAQSPQPSVQIRQAFAQQLQQAQTRLPTASAEELQQVLAQARQQYQAFEAAKDSQTLSENKWRLARQMKQELLWLHLDAAEHLQQRQASQAALQILQAAETLQPSIPKVHFLQAQALLAQDQVWEATKKLYEAKRYNAYPALRRVINPLKPEQPEKVSPEQLNQQIDQALQSLAKDTDYPLSLDFSTGQHYERQLVPGMGARLQGRDGQFFSAYLNQPVNTVLNQLGKPLDIQEVYLRQQNLKFYIYDTHFIVGVNPENEIERIQLSQPGYRVQLGGKTLAIGDSVATVRATLGEEGDIEQLTSSDPLYPQTLIYNDYGLSFGLDPQGRVGVISIWSLA